MKTKANSKADWAVPTVRDRIKELRRVKASELVPNPKNWRKHPKEQSDALRGVLAEVGYADALLARETADGRLMLIDGHLRAETTPDQAVPVLVLDVTEEEADKILLTLDPLAGLATVNDENLRSLMDSVKFSSAELADTLRPLWSDSIGDAPEVVEDAIPAAPATPVARKGDIWLLGAHRLLCGDSTNPADVQRLMGPQRAKLFQTDPPYAVGYSGGSHPATDANGGAANRDKDWSETYHETNDNAFGRDFYLAFCKTPAATAVDPRAAWYCWHASKRQAMLESVWEELGLFVHQQIIWVKTRAVLTYSVYMWQHEPCLFGWVQGNKPQIETKWENYPSTIWQIPNSEIESSDHPTSKPNRLFAIPMQMHTSKGDLCYEPFSGSGSQLIAAEQMERHCYAIEIEPVFVDVAVARWESLTGKKAKVEKAK